MINKFLSTTAVALVLTIAPSYAAETGGVFLEPAATADFASDLIGATVYDRSGDEAQSLGEINDLIVEDDASVSAAIIGVGGFLGMGVKDVAVSFDALEITTDNDGNRYVILPTTKEQLEAAPIFARDTAMAPAMDSVAPEKVTTQDQSVSEEPTADAVATSTTIDQAAVEPRATAPVREGLKAVEASSFSAENLVGVSVYSADNEVIGEVSDVILSQGGAEGAIEAVILDVGGFLGIGVKPVAVTFDSLEILTDADGALYAYSRFTEDQLDAAAAFDADTYEVDREMMLVRPQG